VVCLGGGGGGGYPPDRYVKMHGVGLYGGRVRPIFFPMPFFSCIETIHSGPHCVGVCPPLP